MLDSHIAKSELDRREPPKLDRCDGPRFPISFGFFLALLGRLLELYFSQLSSEFCEPPAPTLNFGSQASGTERADPGPNRTSMELQSSIELPGSVQMSRSSPTPIETPSVGASANANLKSHLHILF